MLDQKIPLKLRMKVYKKVLDLRYLWGSNGLERNEKGQMDNGGFRENRESVAIRRLVSIYNIKIAMDVGVS